METMTSEQPSNSTDFRCTRKTKDLRGWMEMCFLTLVTFPLCYLVHLECGQRDFPLGGLLFVGFAILVFVFQLRERIYPREWELIVNDVEIRWSRMHRSNDRETLSLDKVKHLFVDRAERTVAANTGGLLNRMINPFIFTKVSFAEFLQFMADRHPEIRIVDSDTLNATETETSY